MASQAFAVEYGKPIETAVPVSWGVGSSPDPTPRAMNRLSDALSEVEGAIADSLARAEAIATKMLGPEPPSNPQLAEASDPRRGFMGVTGDLFDRVAALERVTNGLRRHLARLEEL